MPSPAWLENLIFGRDEEEEALFKRRRALAEQAAGASGQDLPKRIVNPLQQVIYDIAGKVSDWSAGGRLYRGTSAPELASRRSPKTPEGMLPGNVSYFGPHSASTAPAADMAAVSRKRFLDAQHGQHEGGLIGRASDWMVGGNTSMPPVGGRSSISPRRHENWLAQENPLPPRYIYNPGVDRMTGGGIADAFSYAPRFASDQIVTPLLERGSDILSNKVANQELRPGGSFLEKGLANIGSNLVPPADTVTGGYGKRLASGGHATTTQGQQERIADVLARGGQGGDVAPGTEQFMTAKEAKGLGSKAGKVAKFVRGQPLINVKLPGSDIAKVFTKISKGKNPGTNPYLWSLALASGAFPTQSRKTPPIAYGVDEDATTNVLQDYRRIAATQAASKRSYGQRHSGDDPLAYQRLIAKNKAQGRDPYYGFSQEERVAYQQKPTSRGVYPGKSRPGHVPPEIRAAQRRQEMGKQAQALSRSKYGQAFQPQQPTPWGIQQQPQQQLPDRITNRRLKMQQNMQRMQQIAELRRRQELAQSGFSVSPTYY